MSPKEKIRRVTLADVSRAAGVSPMTVSNVVRGSHHLVKLATREKVEEAIARLNYRPNLSARSLRSSRACSVGILIAGNDLAFLTDPFNSRLVSGLSNYLSELEYTLDIQGVSPERFESATILNKVGNDALCAILCGPKRLRRRHVEHLQRLGQPTIVFQETFESPSEDICVVAQDDLGGGNALGQHLASKKIESVVFLRPELEWSAIHQRERGLRLALSRGGVRKEVETLVTPTEDFDDVQSAVKQWFSTNRSDVIVGATDSMAVAALKACEDLGISVPGRILIAGFNGFDAWRYTTPTLTTVKSPAYEMGRRAGELLMTRLKERAFPERNVMFPVTFQGGQSTESTV